MKLAIDARSLTTQPTGIGHYLMAAVNVWSAQRPDIEFLLLAHKPLHPQAASALRVAPNLHFDCCPSALMPGNSLWWLLQAFARRARALGATHLWGASGVLPLTGMVGLTTVLTVHDLVFRTLPRTMAWRTRIAYGLLAGRSICRADFLWAVSQFTAREIDHHYPRRRASYIVVGSGLNPLRQRIAPDAAEIAAVAASFGVHERTLLFVGTLEPRKNLAFMLSLMPRLSAGGWHLLVVGCAGWRNSEVAAIVQSAGFPRDSVRFCDYVSDTELQSLYQTVTLFVSTSLLEGFGLPHLEAMAAGCPVVAAANSAMIEVVADGGCLIEGWNPTHWIAALEEAFAQREALQVRAQRQAARQSIAPACVAMSAALQVAG